MFTMLWAQHLLVSEKKPLRALEFFEKRIFRSSKGRPDSRSPKFTTAISAYSEKLNPVLRIEVGGVYSTILRENNKSVDASIAFCAFAFGEPNILTENHNFVTRFQNLVEQLPLDQRAVLVIGLVTAIEDTLGQKAQALKLFQLDLDLTGCQDIIQYLSEMKPRSGVTYAAGLMQVLNLNEHHDRVISFYQALKDSNVFDGVFSPPEQVTLSSFRISRFKQMLTTLAVPLLIEQVVRAFRAKGDDQSIVRLSSDYLGIDLATCTQKEWNFLFSKLAVIPEFAFDLLEECSKALVRLGMTDQAMVLWEGIVEETSIDHSKPELLVQKLADKCHSPKAVADFLVTLGSILAVQLRFEDLLKLRSETWPLFFERYGQSNVFGNLAAIELFDNWLRTNSQASNSIRIESCDQFVEALDEVILGKTTGIDQKLALIRKMGGLRRSVSLVARDIAFSEGHDLQFTTKFILWDMKLIEMALSEKLKLPPQTSNRSDDMPQIAEFSPPKSSSMGWAQDSHLPPKSIRSRAALGTAALKSYQTEDSEHRKKRNGAQSSVAILKDSIQSNSFLREHELEELVGPNGILIRVQLGNSGAVFVSAIRCTNGELEVKFSPRKSYVTDSQKLRFHIACHEFDTNAFYYLHELPNVPREILIAGLNDYVSPFIASAIKAVERSKRPRNPAQILGSLESQLKEFQVFVKQSGNKLAFSVAKGLSACIHNFCRSCLPELDVDKVGEIDKQIESLSLLAEGIRKRVAQEDRQGWDFKRDLIAG